MCRRSAGSGPSLETSDVTLIWFDRKQVKAHKDKFCRGSADSERECPAFTNYKVKASCEKEQAWTLYFVQNFYYLILLSSSLADKQKVSADKLIDILWENIRQA